VTPLCEHFAFCGGCQYQVIVECKRISSERQLQSQKSYQHMSIEAQRLWKLSQVETALHRIGYSTESRIMLAL
jgi:hypothetical protein